MSRHVAGTGLLAVSGASGAGKSSLLRAGVMPRIRAAGLASVPGSQSWACLLLTPTHAPLDELALRVALLAGTGMVRVWNLVTGQPVGAPLETGALSGVSGAAFSPDGKWLASADSDGTVQLWKISLLRHPYAALCADVGPPTRQDWRQYAPGEPEPKVCT
jgi:WD40 repeat protein